MTTTQVGIKLTLDGAAQTEAGLRRVAGGVDSVDRSAGKASGGLSSLSSVAGGLAAGFGAAFAVDRLAAFSQELVSVQRRFDVLNASLVTVSGSQAAAAREFEWIRDFAATTPYQLNEVTQAFVKLKSLGLDASRESLLSYGNTAAAMGKSLDQMVEAVGDASTGEFERLKEFGIRASKQGDQIALTFKGVTTVVGDSAEEITRYLQQIGDVDFAGAMDERARTLDGALSNLADSWEGLYLTISRSGFGDAVANDTRLVASELGLLTEVMESARQRGESLAGVLADGLGAALGRLTFSAVEGTFNGFNGIVNALTGNVLNLNTNLDLLPDNLKSNADQVVILGAKLKEAEAEFAKLQERAKATPDNIYLKSEMVQLAAYIGKVREARDAKALLEGGAGGGRGSINPQTVGQINADEEKAAAARAKARAEFDAKYATDAEKIKNELAKQRKLLGDTFTAEDERRIVASLTRVGAKVKDVGDAFAAQRDAAKSWADAWGKADDLLRDATNESLGLNKAQEQLLGYLTSPAYAQHTEEMRLLVLQKLYAADAQIKLNAELAAEKRWMDESSQANQRAADAAYETTASLEDQVLQQRLANQEIGLTGYALADLKAARLEDAAAEKDRLAAILQGVDPGIADEYRRQAKALRELAAGGRAGAAKEVAVESAREAEREWKRTTDEIERSLTDALMRGFESGKDFAEVLRDTVVNMFKTMVLRPVIQGVVQGGLNAVGLGGPAAGGGGLLGTVNNLSSLYNTGSTVAGWLGLGAATGTGLAATAGTGMALAGTSAGLGLTASAGTGLGLAGAGTGLGLGATAGAGTALTAGTGAAGGAAGGLAGMGPYGWAALAVLAVLGSGFGKTPGEQHMGGYYSSSGKEANLDNAMSVTGGGGWDDGAWARDLIERPDAGLKSFTQLTVDAVLDSAKNSAKALGLDIALGIDAGFAANLNGKGTDKNAFGYAQIFANGELAGEYSNRELGSDMTAAGQKFAAELSDAAAKVLLAGTDFGRTGETASQTLARLGGSLTTVNRIFDTLGETAYAASLAGADLASQLADAFGGLENLTALTSSYYEAYYSEAERAATTTRQVTEALADLGLGLPATREQYRALVEAQDLNTESGRKTYAALLQLAPAFASVTEAVTQTAGGITTVATQARDAAFRQLQASVDAEKALWQRQADGASALRDEVAAVFDILSEGVNALRAEALGPVAAAARGQDTIQQALASARAGLGLPDADALANAIGAARGGMGMENYASLAEQQFAQLKLAGDLEELSRFAGDQLNEAERQLLVAQQQMEALDQTLVYWRDMLTRADAGTEVNRAGYVSVVDAIAELQEAIKPGSTGRRPNAGTQSAPMYANAYGEGSGYTTDPYSMTATQEQIYGGLLAYNAENRTAYEQAQVYLNAVRGGELGLGGADAVAAAMAGAGATQAQIDATAAAAAAYQQFQQEAGRTPQSATEFLSYYGQEDPYAWMNLPRYDVGTNYVPRDMLALIHEGEAVVPKAYNPAAGGQALNTRRLEALVEGLTAEVQRLQTIVNDGNGHQRRSADLLDNVTEGGAGMRTFAA